MSRLTLEQVREILIERQGEKGERAADRLRDWLGGKVPLTDPEALEKHLDTERIDLLFDAFWQWLPFGTGGRRGRVGYGPNRMNSTLVGMTIQGHCDYLRRKFDGEEISVVVANDVRIFKDLAGVYSFLGEGHPLLGASSRTLGRLACEIYAENGIRAYFADPHAEDAVLTTPELSFLIHHLGAKGGINLSASHNPPDDNGIKVYDEYGSQPIAPHDQRLADTMNQVSTVRKTEFAAALESGMILPIPGDSHESYKKTYMDLFSGLHDPDPETPITYTPLNGSGWTTVGEVLTELGFPVFMPPDQGPDGTFKAIPLKAPNPEQPQATEPTCAFAETKGSTLVLSSDPDADRVGAEARLGNGRWYHCDGNQIAAMICYYLMLDPEGPRRKGLVIETLVTTKLLGEIVRRAGDSWIVDDLLVGFKFIADVLKSLKSTGRYGSIRCSTEDLVLAAEESHGIMTVPYIRDKDATPACVLLATLHQKLQRSGRTLLDYYVQILNELGGYDSVSRSIMMVGAEGVQQKDLIMKSLRSSPPRQVAGRSVLEVVDYWDPERFGEFLSDTDKMTRDVVQIKTESLVVTIRPSGTEPKVKIYCHVIPIEEKKSSRTGLELLNEVRNKANEVASAVYSDIVALIGISLTAEALKLPDIIDLKLKVRFQNDTAPQLRQGLRDGSLRSLEQTLDWLRKESGPMTPGSDPLPALKDAVAALCLNWSGELAESPVFAALQEWAGGQRSE